MWIHSLHNVFFLNLNLNFKNIVRIYNMLKFSLYHTNTRERLLTWIFIFWEPDVYYVWANTNEIYRTHNVYLSFVEKNMVRGTPGRVDPISAISYNIIRSPKFIIFLSVSSSPDHYTAADSTAYRYFATDPRIHIVIKTQIFIFMYIGLYILYTYIIGIHYTHVLPSVR